MKIKNSNYWIIGLLGYWALNPFLVLGFDPNINIEKPEEVQVTEIGPLLKAGIQIAIITAAILTFAYLVWGGLQWIMSGGDKAKYEEARNRITAALIGLAIVALAWLMIKIVAYFFGLPDPFAGGGATIPKGF